MDSWGPFPKSTFFFGFFPGLLKTAVIALFPFHFTSELRQPSNSTYNLMRKTWPRAWKSWSPLKKCVCSEKKYADRWEQWNVSGGVMWSGKLFWGRTDWYRHPRLSLVIESWHIGITSSATGFHNADGILGVSLVDLASDTASNSGIGSTVTDTLHPQERG